MVLAAKMVRHHRKVKRKYISYKPNIGHYNVTRSKPCLEDFFRIINASLPSGCIMIILSCRKMFICPALAQITRTDQASRGEIVRRVWHYIKLKELQCKGRGRIFRPDKRLAAALGIDEGVEANGLGVMKHVERHIKVRKEDINMTVTLVPEEPSKQPAEPAEIPSEPQPSSSSKSQ